MELVELTDRLLKLEKLFNQLASWVNFKENDNSEHESSILGGFTENLDNHSVLPEQFSESTNEDIEQLNCSLDFDPPELNPIGDELVEEIQSEEIDIELDVKEEEILLENEVEITETDPLELATLPKKPAILQRRKRIRAHPRPQIGESSHSIPTIQRWDTTSNDANFNGGVSKFPKYVVNPLRCVECGKAFISLEFLNKHKLLRHPEDIGSSGGVHPANPDLDITNPPRLITCEQCGKVFIKRRYYIRHKLIHAGHKPFHCQGKGCKGKFVDAYSLKLHVQRSHKEKPFPCPNCSNSYGRKELLDIHFEFKHANKIKNEVI